MANVTGTNGRDFIHVSGDGHPFPGGGFVNNPGATDLADVITVKRGADIVFAGAGKDTIVMADNLTAADQINGEADEDSVTVDGDYSAGFVFGATTMVNVERVNMAAGHSYNFTTNDATVASLSYLIFDGETLGASDKLTLDARAETDGIVFAIGGAADDFIWGGSHDTVYSFGEGGDDTGIGSTGIDSFHMGAALTAADRLNGGSGFGDTVNLDGDYSAGLVLGRKTVVNVDKITFSNLHDYKLTLNNATIKSGDTMTVDGTALTSANHFTLIATSETDAAITVRGGLGDDVIKTGGGNDTLQGNRGQDTMTPGAGADIIFYGLAGTVESTGVTYDKVVGFDFASMDRFQIVVGKPNGIDAGFNHGDLGKAHFDTKLEAAVTAAKLGADHAVIFTPDSGGLSGHIFLVMDSNGTAGYQAGEDFVIELISPQHLASFDTGDFV